MDHIVLGNSVGDEPVDDPYVVTLSWMSAAEPVSRSTSSVGFSYLVYRPEGHDATWPPTIPTAADSTHPCRRWGDLLPYPLCGTGLLSNANQRPIRSTRYGQPIILPSLMRRAALKRYQLTGHTHHLNHVLHGHYPRRVSRSCHTDFRHSVWKHVYGPQSERSTKAEDAGPHHDIDREQSRPWPTLGDVYNGAHQ
jgi:hypothetical protein